MIDTHTTAGIREALRLTRAGQLHDAVKTIARTLRGAQGVDNDPKDTHAPAPRQRWVEGPGFKHPKDHYGPTATRLNRKAAPFSTGLHDKLREYRGPIPWSDPISDQSGDITPDGGRFITGSYTNQAGTRSYKLYIPSGYHGQPLPLVVMLHGCTQGPDDFAAGTRMNVFAEAHQCFVAYPAQPHAANGSKCWNWFEEAHQQRDRGEPCIIAGLTRRIMNDYRIDARRVYVAGLSAGGAMAMTLAMIYPDLYAAAGIHSGLAYAVAKDLPSAFSAMHGGPGTADILHTAGSSGTRFYTTHVPVIVFHGDGDTTVHPDNGDQIVAQCAPPPARAGGQALSQAGGNTSRASVERGQAPRGHAYTRTTYHGTGGHPAVEYWLVHGAGHAWSGGSPQGSYTDPLGPDASKEMLRFFYDHPQGEVQ
jgi:poly(hydroxyalkanoate) depolymerase family esterase